MPQTYQEAWNELVMKCQYDTGGMNINEFQKSLVVWADSWVRAAQRILPTIEVTPSNKIKPGPPTDQ